MYSDMESKLVSITVDGVAVIDEQKYTITLQGYHFINSETNLNISNDEIIAMGIPKVVSTSAYGVLEEWLRQHQNITREIEGRIVFETGS